MTSANTCRLVIGWDALLCTMLQAVIETLRLRHADVNVVTSLCKEGADLYARDHEGRDAFLSCCYWLNERSQSVHWTARHVWSRINYWIGVFQPSLVKQWQMWELVGAQASLDLDIDRLMTNKMKTKRNLKLTTTMVNQKRQMTRTTLLSMNKR
jgi:hypothetical protein